MGKRRVLHPAPVFDRKALSECLHDNQIKDSHAISILQFLAKLHKSSAWAEQLSAGVSNEPVPVSIDLQQLDNLHGIPQKSCQVLMAGFSSCTSKVVGHQRSADGSTHKLLVELQDGHRVESCVMVYGSKQSRGCEQGDDDHADEEFWDCQSELGGGAEHSLDAQFVTYPPVSVSGSDCTGNKKRPTRERATLCVSSQIGCQMGCTFCATGTMGMLGNLWAGEIVEQLMHAQVNCPVPIRNVVFMGMGEPLNNYEAVLDAIGVMTKCFGLAPRHITVSTVGVVPRMRALGSDAPEVKLALSLHAPTQELRQVIVPAAKAYKLDSLMGALDDYQRRTRRRVFVEYVVLAGVNDSEEVAHQAGRLLSQRDVVLNLIPFNPTFNPSLPKQYEAPTNAAINAFHRIMSKEYGVPTTVRFEKGQDINGACGQLVVAKSNSNESTRLLGDIEDLMART